MQSFEYWQTPALNQPKLVGDHEKLCDVSTDHLYKTKNFANIKKRLTNSPLKKLMNQ